MLDTLTASPAAPPAPSGACPACGARLATDFCGNCGQEARERLTIGLVLRNVASTVFGLNRGLLYTFLSLSRSPGRVVSDYVAGATVSYTNPVSYLLLCASITALLFTSFGGIEDFIRGFNAGYSGGAAATTGDAVRRVAAHASIILAFVVPVAALASHTVFSRSGHNFAEHLVFNAYVIAQTLLLATGLDLLARMLAGPELLAGAAAPAVMGLVTLAYYACAAIPFFGEERIPGLLRSAGTIALSCAVYLLLAGFGVALTLGLSG